MAKKKKIPQLTGSLLDFDDMFGGGDLFAEKSKNTAPPKSDKTSKPPPTKNKKSTPSSGSEPQSSSTVDAQDLEAWLKQSEEIKSLKQELSTIGEVHQAQKAAFQKEKEAVLAQLTAIQEQHQQQLASLQTEIEQLKSQLLSEKQALASHQEQLRFAKDEVERVRQEIETQKENHHQQSEWLPLTELLNDRGLRTHAEFTSFFRVVGASAHSWTVWKDAQVHKDTFRTFLSEQVHLVSESIHDASSIPGVCIPVDQSKCEISGGVSLLDEVRDLVSEVLLQGWNKVLILGVPVTYVNFLRHQLSQGSIEVQVDPRGDKWIYTSEMNTYPVVVLFGGGQDKIPKTCTSTVFCYQTTVIGEGIRQCRQDIETLSEQ